MATEFRPCVKDDGTIIPFYLVNNQGDVYSERTSIFLKPQLVGGRKDSRYFLVQMGKDVTTGKRYQELVHRLVGKAFISLPPTPEHVINHKDGNKHNNHVDNLEWMTQAENIQHASEIGLIRKGENHATSKLTECNVRAIRKHRKLTWKQCIKISQQYGVVPSVIDGVWRRRTWKHVA